MEPILAVVVGALFAIAVYLLMSRSLIRIVLGVFVLGNAANLTIFTAGRVNTDVPPVIPLGTDVLAQNAANPLPQALVLTAIVIGFALMAFAMVLALRAYQALDTLDTDAMTAAEGDGTANASQSAESDRG